MGARGCFGRDPPIAFRAFGQWHSRSLLSDTRRLDTCRASRYASPARRMPRLQVSGVQGLAEPAVRRLDHARHPQRQGVSAPIASRREVANAPWDSWDGRDQLHSDGVRSLAAPKSKRRATIALMAGTSFEGRRGRAAASEPQADPRDEAFGPASGSERAATLSLSLPLPQGDWLGPGGGAARPRAMARVRGGCTAVGGDALVWRPDGHHGAPSLDHPFRAQEDRLRDDDPKRPRGLHVHHQLELRR